MWIVLHDYCMIGAICRIASLALVVFIIWPCPFARWLRRTDALSFIPGQNLPIERRKRASSRPSQAAWPWKSSRAPRPAFIFGGSWVQGLPVVHCFRLGLRFQDVTGQSMEKDVATSVEQALSAVRILFRSISRSGFEALGTDTSGAL